MTKTKDINLYFNPTSNSWVLELYGVSGLVETNYFGSVEAARYYILKHY